jgi:hypothetical protein
VMVAGSWVLVGSKVGPLPSISSMIKDVIMREIGRQGQGFRLSF